MGGVYNIGMWVGGMYNIGVWVGGVYNIGGCVYNMGVSRCKI